MVMYHVIVIKPSLTAWYVCHTHTHTHTHITIVLNYTVFGDEVRIIVIMMVLIALAQSKLVMFLIFAVHAPFPVERNIKK